MCIFNYCDTKLDIQARTENTNRFNYTGHCHKWVIFSNFWGSLGQWGTSNSRIKCGQNSVTPFIRDKRQDSAQVHA